MIQTEGYTNYKATLFDVMGKKVQEGIGLQKMELLDYPSGICILQIEDLSTKERIVERIIVE